MRDESPNIDRRHFLLAIGLSGLAATGCASDGHFSVFGYTTRPNYDTDIQTVYVPIFQNRAFQTTTQREEEMELTRAVIREIEARTPYKVVSNPDKADTELLGTILRQVKGIANRNQQNEVREIELNLVVEVVWRDLRTGKVLSNAPTPPSDPKARPVGPAFDPTVPQPEPGPDKAVPVAISATGRALPEAGESNMTAQQMAINRIAVKVANLMEKPWPAPARDCPK